MLSRVLGRWGWCGGKGSRRKKQCRGRCLRSRGSRSKGRSRKKEKKAPTGKTHARGAATQHQKAACSSVPTEIGKVAVNEVELEGVWVDVWILWICGCERARVLRRVDSQRETSTWLLPAALKPLVFVLSCHGNYGVRAA